MFKFCKTFAKLLRGVGSLLLCPDSLLICTFPRSVALSIDTKTNMATIATHLHANQSIPVSCSSTTLPWTPTSHLLLRLAAVIVEHFVQRREDGRRLLLPHRMMVGAGHQLRRTQPMVTDAVLAAHALATATHQTARALPVHDDAGKVFTALVADALRVLGRHLVS